MAGFVAERNGRVQLYDPKTDNMQVILDLKSDMRGESGLIGLALAPDFEKSGWIYMYHTVEIPGDSLDHMHHLARFTYKNGKVDRASEKGLLKVKATIKRIHEAGSISFDKDGNLYLSTGDNQYKKEYSSTLVKLLQTAMICAANSPSYSTTRWNLHHP